MSAANVLMNRSSCCCPFVAAASGRLVFLAGYQCVPMPVRKLLLTLLHYNLLPDFVLRWLIRRGVAQTALEYDDAEPEIAARKKQAFVDDLKSREIAVNQEDANEQHYEVPPKFFETILGPHLKYSCGYWGEDCQNDSLAESEENMLRLCCERAGVEDGMNVLDLGCGWGSLALYIASRFPACHVTALSNSKPQGDFIRSRAQHQSISNLHVVTADVAKVELSNGTFDRVLSVEMFEHMKNYEKLLEKISGWLKPGGKLFFHIMTTRKLPYHFERGWMARTFFTGGMMPSHDLPLYFQKDLKFEKQWALSGRHYQKTLNTWLNIYDQKIAVIRPILVKTYGESNYQKWYVNWRLFFMVCAESFGYKQGREWIVSHFLMTK